MATRRTFLKGLVAAATTLILPPTLDENAEAAKRFWSLDFTMLEPEPAWQLHGDFRPPAQVIRSFIDDPSPYWEGAYTTIDVSDSSFLRRGDLLRIVGDSPPEELMVITAIHRDGTFTVRR